MTYTSSLEIDGPTSSVKGHTAAVLPLIVGAIGVVFGDIGTSPLYTLRVAIGSNGDHEFSQDSLFGIISMITWCLIIIVTLTYVGTILRADNHGEGGILSLAAMMRSKMGRNWRYTPVVVAVSILGASLFLGDSMITPAISVMSAAEGLRVISPGFEQWIVPVSLVLLTVLFAVQRRGTGGLGAVFGPVMVVWFVVLAIMGVSWIVRNPEVLLALSPTYAVSFIILHPWMAFLALGASVLAVTGAEALYADLGHFGRRPIAMAWLFLVFPALVINYLGQGALLMERPEAIANPLFNMVPSGAVFPLVILATAATIIASQAVITGAFSIVRQAVRLSFLPRLRIVQTSPSNGGRIYIPLVNLVIYIVVFILVTQFGSSDALASAYGIAVTGTFLLELTLFLMYAKHVWKWSALRTTAMLLASGLLELALFVANLPKIITGGWLPLLIAVCIATVMFTWNRGSQIMFSKRRQMEGSLQSFAEEVRKKKIQRVPGVAIYPQGGLDTCPLALRESVKFNHVLHEHVVVVTVKHVDIPHVPDVDRIEIHDLGWKSDGIVQIVYNVGFNDPQDVQEAVQIAVGRTKELDFSPQAVTYVLSVYRIGACQIVCVWGLVNVGVDAVGVGDCELG
ncbi:KUP/HAK/KT family potassium transporter [Actinomycetaceae bacterium MB13-C1-2]|nr:KUP/HAK/KT family potassium transporter [Actinomycetaceae bacterium MB13-C1-2]